MDWGGVAWERSRRGGNAYLQPATDADTFLSGFAGGAGGPLPGGPCAVATSFDSQPEKPSCACRPHLVLQSSCLIKSPSAYKCLNMLDRTLARSSAAQHQGLLSKNAGSHGHPSHHVQRSYEHRDSTFGVLAMPPQPSLLALQTGRQANPYTKQGQQSHVHSDAKPTGNITS